VGGAEWLTRLGNFAICSALDDASLCGLPSGGLRSVHTAVNAIASVTVDEMRVGFTQSAETRLFAAILLRGDVGL
jgi:hypothetical protein